MILCLLSLASAPGRADDQAKAIAYDYYRQALSLETAGSEAARLLDISLEFFPDFSESCYLYGLIRLRDQETTREGIAWLRKAIGSSTWMETDPEQAKTKLAQALVRTRQYAQARSLLDGPSASGLGARDNPDAALLWAAALRGLGDTAGAARYLEEGLKRYPSDRRFYLHLARALRGLGRTSEALAVVNRGRRELPLASELSLEAARLSSGRAQRLELVKEYYQRGGADPEAAALALTLEPDRPQHLELFFQKGGNGRLAALDVLLTYFSTRSGNATDALLLSVRQYTGTRVVDADEDGFYEELYTYDQGALESWKLDKDQDGVPEAEARFAAGAPQSFSVHPLEYRYSAYPFLGEVAVRGERGLRVYAILPYQVRLEPFAGSPGFGVPSKLAPLRLSLRSQPWPDERRVMGLSYNMKEYKSGSLTPERQLTLQNGQILRIEEFPDREGRFSHVVEWARGSPLMGRRDLDEDGIFEIQEEYSQGRLAGISLDQDGDGRPEMRQRLEPSGTRTFWDYNGDGTADSAEYSGPDAVREFSTRLDGTFDLRASFRSGVLVRFQRGGRSLPVVSAPGRALYWIGRPGPSVEPFLSLPEGLHWIGGLKYFVFIHQGQRYVEPL